MCDCNMSSYWNGISCVLRLAPNVSCSFEYQCQTNLTCIVNETYIGIFSDVCRCPLGSYYVSGSGCVTSKAYLATCVGSYQCLEAAPLICRYNDTAATCYANDGGSLPCCDCNEDYYYDSNTSTCIELLQRSENCTKDCQCISPYVCQSSQCACQYFYSSINQACVVNLQYGDQCTSSIQCQATPNTFMTCMSTVCACNSSGVWNGSQCTFTVSFRSSCSSNSGCNGGLICSVINCIDPSKGTCACPNNTYFNSTNQSCLSCNGYVSGGFTKYVIRYPTTDLCVAVYNPTSSSYITLTYANSTCSSLPPMKITSTPQLLSVDTSTELNCIASDFRRLYNFGACPSGGINYYFYLGYNSASGRFYDGTYGCALSPSLCLSTTQCLTFCSDNNDNVGHLNFATCSGSYTGPGPNIYIGAICDYGVN
jgi:hypothetical protein